MKAVTRAERGAVSSSGYYAAFEYDQPVSLPYEFTAAFEVRTKERAEFTSSD